MELEPWLILLQAAPPPALSLVKLLRHTADPTAVLAMSSEQLRAAGLSAEICRRLQQPDRALLKSREVWLARPEHHLLPLGRSGYPALLSDLPDPPLALWVRGNPSALAEPQLALVGSRNPTQGGLDNARNFARALATAGLTITSGLALGIDGAAHAAALDNGAPTVAVLGCGPDIIYPRQHGRLARDITTHGALVSEYPPGPPAQRHHFPCRNRIIAGLALGTLVVEASRKSGALITARRAGDYGREVFAIPGSIHNPMARGCHQLIRQGAKLVEQEADIVQELTPQLGTFLTPDEDRPGRPPGPGDALAKLSPEHRELLKVMGFDPVGLMHLTKRSGLTAAELSSMLLVLELEGFVEALPGDRYSRIEKTAE